MMMIIVLEVMEAPDSGTGRGLKYEGRACTVLLLIQTTFWSYMLN